jgi:hypothetical protein
VEACSFVWYVCRGIGGELGCLVVFKNTRKGVVSFLVPAFIK